MSVISADPTCLSDLAAPWDALVPNGARLGPFPTSSWARLWWTSFAEGSLRVATTARGERIEAVVPLYLEPGGDDRRLLFLGGRDITDYTGPAASGSGLGAAAAVALEAAAEERAALECVSTPDDWGFAEALLTAAERAGLAHERTPSEPAPYLDLPGDPEEWLAGLDKKERHELRRKIRRFERELGVPELRRANVTTLDDDLELFFGWHRQAPGEKATFMSGARVGFFRSLAREMSDRGWLALDILSGGGAPIAAGFSFVVGDTVYLYNSSFAPEAHRWSPGMVLIAQLVERSIADGLARLDFLKGDERYKFQLGGVRRELSHVWVEAPRR